MKKILTLLLCCTIFCANATTYVSGIIATNTTWTKANSPYIVNGNLSVDSTVTLTIQPGVTVRVDSGHFFYIDGRLIAEGTSTDSIIFTADSVRKTLYHSYMQWKGIEFRIKAKNDTNKFKYCRFEYAAGAIYTEGPSLDISHSVFRYNVTAISVKVFPPATDCYFAISKCRITENYKGIYHYSRYGHGELTENEISNNSVGCEDESYIGLIAHNNSFNYNETGLAMRGYQKLPSIRWNTFKGNSYAGLTFRNSPSNLQPYARTTAMPLSDNLFIYNTIGLQIWDIDECAITHNTIAYNNIGIDRSSIASNTPHYPVNLVISNNCLTNNISYNFKENYQADFTAPGNWWGTVSIAGIDSTIYDYYDNFSSGKITYTPILTSDSGCQSVPPPPQCRQPDSVIANVTSTTTASVLWPAVAGALGYEYYIEFLHSAPPNSGSITTDTSLNLTGLTPGAVYKVCVRTKCVAAPFIFTWVCDTLQTPTGVKDTESGVKDIRIYPNPNNGTFNVSLNNDFARSAMLTVYDLTGRKVISKQMNTTNEPISLGSSAVKGVYIIQILTDNTVLNKRIVVE